MVSVHRAVPYFSVVTLVPYPNARQTRHMHAQLHISQSLSIHVRDAIRALSSLLLS